MVISATHNASLAGLEDRPSSEQVPFVERPSPFGFPNQQAAEEYQQASSFGQPD
jgi:hypothetical protein